MADARSSQGSEDALRDVRRALVVGLGRSGPPAVRALRGAGVAVVAADSAADLDLPAEIREHAEVHLGVTDDELVGLLADAQLLVPSPGVPEHAPVVQGALRRRLPVWSEPELGWRSAPRRTVAITGTNGKTTVTELTAAMLQHSGVDAVACGNIGNPYTSAALDSDPDATLVAELSSFQLRFCHLLRAHVGVLLNVAPDHLDWHGSFDEYAAAKARVWQRQAGGDWAVANLDDDPAARLARQHAPASTAWFSSRGMPEVGVGVQRGELTARLPAVESPIVALDELPLAVPHHVANLAAAACAALLAGGETEAVADVARRRRPGAHRLEEVAEVDGVRFLDDSKATNPHAAAAALRAVAGRGAVIWIAGGQAKGVDLSVLGPELSVVDHAVLIGEAAERLAAVASEAGVPTTHARSIEEAVRVASELARPGDTVLLAPACASFDQFRDYAERGDRFAAAARGLRGEEVVSGG